MIAIVDYGAGNLVSVKKAIDWLGRECVITSDPAEVRRASKVILPGVGHFASTASLARSGLQESISEAIAAKVPFLGICVGMQWMFSGSEESPKPVAWACFRGSVLGFPIG
jgi:imidazole glycerol-phosphate synthase subunit HisH